VETGASEHQEKSTMSSIDENIKIVRTDKLRPHEEVDQERVEEVARCIQNIGLQYPVVADRKTNIILDGHHRYNAFRKMKIKDIPVYYIDYEDKQIIIDSWTGNKITKEDVIKKVDSGGLFPQKTTKHMLLTEKGLAHISISLPRVNLKIEKLKTTPI